MGIDIELELEFEELPLTCGADLSLVTAFFK